MSRNFADFLLGSFDWNLYTRLEGFRIHYTGILTIYFYQTYSRVFDYNTNRSNMASVDASIRHTFRAHRMELSKYHYDNIAKLEFDIAKYDEQFRKDPTTTFSSEYRRLRYLRTRQRFELESTVDTRQEAVELLQLLRNKWPKIALVLREESRKLFVLPRERKCFMKCGCRPRSNY